MKFILFMTFEPINLSCPASSRWRRACHIYSTCGELCNASASNSTNNFLKAACCGSEQISGASQHSTAVQSLTSSVEGRPLCTGRAGGGVKLFTERKVAWSLIRGGCMLAFAETHVVRRSICGTASRCISMSSRRTRSQHRITIYTEAHRGQRCRKTIGITQSTEFYKPRRRNANSRQRTNGIRLECRRRERVKNLSDGRLNLQPWDPPRADRTRDFSKSSTFTHQT